jgi:iron complex outermembrane receptor protein
VSHRLTTIALALLALPAATLAQTAPPPEAPVQQLERVEVTGSAIKRIASETALPVQTISRADIDKAGVTTAAELLARVSANVGGLTDGISINVGGDQRGFNAANLRGIGTSSTLVLLNGRRMANFASPGDDAGVDLNTIPAAAIQRVEILLDGASALYGTDAIGGVINFITRKDFAGLDLSAYRGVTSEGGASKGTATLAAGVGNVARDGFNAFVVLDGQRTSALFTGQRAFISDLKIPERLPHLLSGFTSPANIRLTRDQRDYLQDAGFTIGGKSIVNRTINLTAPTCNAPANLYLPGGTGGEDACTYDYMRDTELYPRSEKTSLLGRGVFQLADKHQAYVELSLARARTWYVGSTARTTGTMDINLIPALAATGLRNGVNADGDPLDTTVDVRVRLTEAGRRSSQLTSAGNRLVTGLTGELAGWDYDLAYARSNNTVRDRNVNGYLLYDQLQDGIANGLINPFGPSSAAGRALLNSIQVNDEVRYATGTMESVDFKLSRALTRMAGGDMAVAFGGEARRERTRFVPSALLLSDNIEGDPAPEGGGTTRESRKVNAVYSELLLPFAPQWELQLSGRYDRYQGIGGAASPKAGLRFMATPQWLLRGSVGAGFRAPSVNDLYRPTVFSATAILADPVYCSEEGNDLSVCADAWDTRRYSNANLKPERSRQFSVGTVFELNKRVSMAVDYWNIKRTKLISEIGDDVILGNLAKYEPLVHRFSEDEGLAGCDFDPDDNTICFIELRKENRGAQKTSGLDFKLEAAGLQSAWGTWGARFNGTLVLASKLQNSPGDSYISNLGRFVTKGVVQRWRHRISVDWDKGPFGATLSNSYSSAYTDQNNAINTDDGSVVKPNRVKAYSLWDASASWTPNKTWRLRVGVQNLFNTAPPYSNQAYYFISGYDPSYTDPRGRFGFVQLQYSLQ